MVVHASDPSTSEVETGGSGDQSHPLLHIKFEAILGYKRPCGIPPPQKKIIGIENNEDNHDM